jgi:hypothetical protein
MNNISRETFKYVGEPGSGYAGRFPRLSSPLPSPLPGLKLRRYRFLPHPALIITHTHMLYSLIYWKCPKLRVKIIKWILKKGCCKRPKRTSEATTKTNLKQQNRIRTGVTYLRKAHWRIAQTAIKFRTSFSRNTLLRGMKLRLPVLMLSRFFLVSDTVIETQVHELNTDKTWCQQFCTTIFNFQLTFYSRTVILLLQLSRITSFGVYFVAGYISVGYTTKLCHIQHAPDVKLS